MPPAKKFRGEARTLVPELENARAKKGGVEGRRGRKKLRKNRRLSRAGRKFYERRTVGVSITKIPVLFIALASRSALSLRNPIIAT